MKKFISLCFASFLCCVVAYSQDANVETAPKADKAATCVPTKECAAKMGISLEECKKICAAKKAEKTASTSVQSAMVVKEDGTAPTAKAKCCSIEECAAKLGITVEECKARMAKNGCGTEKASTTKVASAVLDRDAEAPKAKKACCAKAKATACGKKAETKEN